MTELKSCPFCGGKGDMQEMNTLFTVSCHTEDCQGNNCECCFYKEDDAAKAWNARPSQSVEAVGDDAVRGAVKLLEHAYKQCCVNLQPKHKEIGTIGFDMAGWIAKSIEIITHALSQPSPGITEGEK